MAALVGCAQPAGSGPTPATAEVPAPSVVAQSGEPAAPSGEPAAPSGEPGAPSAEATPPTPASAAVPNPTAEAGSTSEPSAGPSPRTGFPIPAGEGSTRQSGADSRAAGSSPARADASPPAASRSTAGAPSEPVVVDVPGIGVRSELVRLGLDDRGELAAPADYDRAGWFTGGPAPGAVGPAVIAGHVDSKTGPAVFYRLTDLRRGDSISVTRHDGKVVRFAVTEVRRVPKNAFPTADVYGPVPGPELRLITCGGDFDRARGSYRDNVVVFAALAA